MLHIDGYGLVQLSPEDLIGQSVAVLGVKGYGKSNTAAVLMEELLEAGVPVAVVDIAGEYHTLKDRYEGLTVVGRSITCEVDLQLTYDNVRQVAETAYINGQSVVIDLSGVPSVDRAELLAIYFRQVWRLSALSRIPLMVFLEEAHNWIPQRGKTPVKVVFVDIAAEGRKRGLGLVIVTQRSSRVDKDVLTQAGLAFLHRVTHPSDLKVYFDMVPRPKAQVKQSVSRLKIGECLFLNGEQVLRPKVRMRETKHVGSTPGMGNIPRPARSLLDLMSSKYD